MQIKEIATKKLDKENLKEIINNNFSNLDFYGECDNLLFIKKNDLSSILNVDCNNDRI